MLLIGMKWLLIKNGLTLVLYQSKKTESKDFNIGSSVSHLLPSLIKGGPMQCWKTDNHLDWWQVLHKEYKGMLADL